MTHSTVLEKLEAFVRESFLYARPDLALSPHDPLMKNGIMDSMGVMELVEFLEEAFDVVVPDEDITEANLGTLESVARYVIDQHANRAA